jgi:hypothetical protein
VHRIILQIASWVWAALVFGYPLCRYVFEHLAATYGWWEHPAESAGSLIAVVQSLWDVPWVRAIVLVSTGYVAGLWTDYLLRRVDGSRAQARKNLGLEMRALAGDVGRLQSQITDFTWPGHYTPRLVSLSLKAKSMGMWFPEKHTTQHATLEYLLLVGTLLSDGHFSQAKKQAAFTRKEQR